MNAPATPAAKPAKDTVSRTNYIVLSESDDHTWTIVKSIHAASGSAAIRAYLTAANPVQSPRNSYVAVPERSWHPVTAKIDTKTVLTLT
jgi:hypothetical protein